MFEPNLSIDISLLAIILGLYATKNDRNLILLLICLLFAHVLLTNDEDDPAPLLDDDYSSVDEGHAVVVPKDNLGAGTAKTSNQVSPVPAVSKNPTTTLFNKTVSFGVFDRQLSSPQTNLTSTVLPSSSTEANGKLAAARDSFFKSLVS